MLPLALVVPAALAQLLRTAPLSDGKVEFAWRAVVGPALVRATAVKLDGRVLLVEAASVEWAREVTRSSTMILARLQRLLGPETVSGITVRGYQTDQPS